MVKHNAVNALAARHKWVLLFAPTVFIAVVIIIPFLLLVSGTFSQYFFREIFSSGPTGVLMRRAIWNSLVQGFLSSVSCFALGFPMGLFLGRYSFRFRRLITSFILIPFFLPSVIVVFAFMTGFGSYSPFNDLFHFGTFLTRGLTGIIAVNTFFNAPVVALFTMIAASRVDRTQYEAAETLYSSRLRIFRTVWGRDAFISGIGGALLAFIYSFAGFAAPLIMGGPGQYTVDAWVYSLVRIFNSLSAAIALSLVEALILIIPVLIYVFAISRNTGVEGYNPALRPESTGKDPFFRAGSVYSVIWLIVELYLLFSVFLSSFQSRTGTLSGLSNYYALFSTHATTAAGIWAGASIANTLFYGFTVSLSVVTVGLVWIYGTRRSGRRMRSLAEIPQFAPLVVSAVIMAFAISSFFGDFTPSSLIWVLIIAAQTAVAIPVVLRILQSGFSSIPKTFTEASFLLNGSPFLDVEIPLARNAFVSALMFGFAISLGEFSATNFLATGSFVPLTVEMYSLQDARLFGPAFAAASILLVISLVSFYFIQKMGERFIGIY